MCVAALSPHQYVWEQMTEFLSLGKKTLCYQSLFETMGLTNHDSKSVTWGKIQESYGIWLGKIIRKMVGKCHITVARKNHPLWAWCLQFPTSICSKLSLAQPFTWFLIRRQIRNEIMVLISVRFLRNYFCQYWIKGIVAFFFFPEKREDIDFCVWGQNLTCVSWKEVFFIFLFSPLQGLL